MTVFFDVDTQIDFLYPAGALYVPGAETIVERITALNGLGKFIISTMDAHSEDDPEFKVWPHHCVVGTTGQQKAAATLLPERMVVPNAVCDLKLVGVRQVLLEKQTIDCFDNVNLQSLLQQLNADRYVVYGVVTEICVRIAALGLLKTGRKVEVVTDAVRSLTDPAGAQALAEFTAAGGVLTTVSQVQS